MSDQDSLLGKIKVITGFVNSVGVPMFMLIVVLVVSYGTWAGYIESPIATRLQLQEHALNTQQLHESLLQVGERQVDVLRGIEKEFKAMRCERQIKADDKIDCLSRLSREPDKENGTHRRYHFTPD